MGARGVMRGSLMKTVHPVHGERVACVSGRQEAGGIGSVPVLPFRPCSLLICLFTPRHPPSHPFGAPSLRPQTTVRQQLEGGGSRVLRPHSASDAATAAAAHPTRMHRLEAAEARPSEDSGCDMTLLQDHQGAM